MKMVDIVKVSNNGVEVYPRTHASAVLGLSSTQGPKGDPGTNATTTAVATTTTNGLMAAADKVKLNNLPVITFEKVGTV